MTTINGKPAIETKALKIATWGPKNRYLFQYGKRWVPNHLSEYNEETGMLTVEKWYYDKYIKALQ